MGVRTRTLLALLAASAACAVGSPDGKVLDKLLLAGLRAARHAVNAEIKKDSPDPWAIDYEAGNVSEVCIVPGFHHSCICHAGVGYNVTLTTLAGVSDLRITSFDSVHAEAKNLSFYELTIEASLDDQNLGASGTARGSVSACGIAPSLNGHATSDGNATGTVTMQAQGRVVKREDVEDSRRAQPESTKCMLIEVTRMSIPALDADLHNVHVDLDFGILHIPISYFVDLFKGPLKKT